MQNPVSRNCSPQEITHEPSNLVCLVFQREVPGIESVIFGRGVVGQDLPHDFLGSRYRSGRTRGDYPYPGEPETEVERAERETFDYVATTVARKIPKSQLGRRTTLGLLKVAVANEPSSVAEIIDQLMPLPKGEQQDLARLLKRTSMSKLIEANT
jgi:hypothetical protein